METNFKQSEMYKKLLKSYDPTLDHHGVKGDRLAYRLSKLAEIGLTSEGGSYRMGFSEEERKSKNLVKKWMVEAGLTVSEDGAGNVFGKLTGQDLSLPSLLSGSHLDSVPNGGHFDGPLGVLSALEVVEAWIETGHKPNRSFEVTIFTDEEGARFNGGLFGSRAFTGSLDKNKVMQLSDFNDKPFAEVISEYGLSEEKFFEPHLDTSKIEAFIEVHVEQGKRLEKAAIPVGIVTGIAGPCWVEMTFVGDAGHAGNTPMDERRDALVAAGEFIREVHTLPKTVSSSAVTTIGKLNVFPNGINVIPGEVRLVVDIRDIHEDKRDELVGLVIEAAKKSCEIYGVELSWKESLRVQPILIKKELLNKLENAVKANNIDPYYLPSGAGHDAMVIGNHIPVAMLFVQSENGVSHTPAEWSKLNDCVETIHVLKHMIENY